MQSSFWSTTRAIFAFGALLFGLPQLSLADSISLTSSAVSSTTLGASSDTLSLNGGSATFTTGSSPFTFQTGSFFIGNSPIADQIIPFSLQDTITLNGVTQSINIFGQDNVTTTADDLTIFAGTPILFGNELFDLQSFTVSGVNIGDNLTVNLQASVAAAPTPEPGSLLLLGTAVFGAAILLGRRSRRLQGRKTSFSGRQPLDLCSTRRTWK